MIRHVQAVIARALLAVGFALVLAGCSESSSPDPTPASAPQSVSLEPSKPLTAKEKKAQQREFDNMGVKEKREWRKQQRAAAGGTTS